jgi:LuxR family transcriptional regulator
MHDPVMRWIYGNEGVVRWSEIEVPDSMGVLDHAAEFGLNYGASVCINEADGHGLRSFASFCRSDRDYFDDELDDLTKLFRKLHDELSPPDNVTDAELEALSMVREGLLIKEVAYRLDISEGAVKQRLRAAKSKLNARTNAQAVDRASKFGLI